MVKIIRAESEKTLMRKVKECFFSRNESSYALVMKEKNPLDSAFSVIHKVLRLGLHRTGEKTEFSTRSAPFRLYSILNSQKKFSRYEKVANK